MFEHGFWVGARRRQGAVVVIGVLAAAAGLSSAGAATASPAPSVTGSLGAGTNVWWSADTAVLALPQGVGSLTFQIKVPLTTGVSYTGGWSTMPAGATESAATTASALTCTFTNPSSLASGQYTFVCGFNTGGNAHPLSLDSWVLKTVGPTQNLSGPMQAAAPPTTTTLAPTTSRAPTTTHAPTTTSPPTTTVPSGGVAPPAALPQRLGIGVAAAPTDITGGFPAQSKIPFDYVYQYLSGGAGTSSDWATWNSNAMFPLYYAQSAAAAHHVPVFSYYQLLQSADTCGSCGEQQRDLTNLNSASLMAAYFADFATLMKRLGHGTYGGVAGFGETAVVQVEPDLSAYAEQAVLSGGQCFGFCIGAANNPANLKAAVASSGDADVAGYANTYAGFVGALAHLRDLYAPNVLLGYHVSNWASATDIGSNPSATLNVTALADEVVSFSKAAGAGRYDLIFNDVLDRDAGYYQTVYGNPNVWWDRDNVTFPNFHRWESYLGTILAGIGKPGVVWQIPLGNQYYDTENNTTDHYQDNRVEYFFAHPTELSSIGVVALLFGPGAGGQTGFGDADNDGIANYAPICITDGSSQGQICNNHTALNSDDDGGYFRTAATAYYQHPVTLP